jgi:2-amino-4-hydroxy-6-hydroxymethyldihydropteridine diphosphokinase
MTPPDSRRAVLGLGSNQGDRLATLQGAIDALAATPGVIPVAVSGVFETDPVGGPEQPDYLNAVVVIETTLQAPELLERAHQIEQQHDRVRSERWGPRTLDIDLVAVGADVIAELDLVIPHPRAAQRAFVLVPWVHADPEASLPGHGPVVELLAGLDASGVRARPDLALRLEPAR